MFLQLAGDLSVTKSKKDPSGVFPNGEAYTPSSSALLLSSQAPLAVTGEGTQFSAVLNSDH